eukprot:7221323-Ditylum_brightwellii.AAC.1
MEMKQKLLTSGYIPSSSFAMGVLRRNLAGINAVANTSDDTLYSASEKNRAKLYKLTVDGFMAAANEGNPLFAIVVTVQLISQVASNEIKEVKILPYPLKQPSVVHQTSIVACLDVLEEEVGIKK